MSNLLNIKDQNGNWIPIPVVTNGIKTITQNNDYTLTITLNDGTTYTISSIKGADGQDYILTENDKQEIAGLVDASVEDVQVNGGSIVSNGVASIPLASADDYGVVAVYPSASAQVKAGSNAARPIVPSTQHESVFYRLAKAAGDTTQSASSNAVGTYTDDAKTAIRTMLGIDTASLVAEIRDALNL